MQWPDGASLVELGEHRHGDAHRARTGDRDADPQHAMRTGGACSMPDAISAMNDAGATARIDVATYLELVALYRVARARSMRDTVRSRWPEFFIGRLRLPAAATRELRSRLAARDDGVREQRHAEGSRLRRYADARARSLPPAARRRCVADRPSVRVGDTIESEANYAVFRTRQNELSEVFNVGRYVDVVHRTPAGLRFASRICVFHSEMIPTSIIIRFDRRSRHRSAAAPWHRRLGMPAGRRHWRSGSSASAAASSARREHRGPLVVRSRCIPNGPTCANRVILHPPAESSAAIASCSRFRSAATHARSSRLPARRAGIDRRIGRRPSSCTRRSPTGLLLEWLRAGHDRPTMAPMRKARPDRRCRRRGIHRHGNRQSRTTCGGRAFPVRRVGASA